MYVSITIDLSVLNIDRYAYGYKIDSVVCWCRVSSYKFVIDVVGGWMSPCNHGECYQLLGTSPRTPVTPITRYLPFVAEEKVDIDAFKAWFQKMKEARGTTRQLGSGSS